MIRRLRHDPTWWFSLQIPFLRAPAACWWARAMVESTDTSRLIRPAASAKPCNAVTIWRHVPSRCHRRNSAYTADQDPYSTGTSRQGAPTRTRQRIRSINCRLVHNDGRPGRFAVGNNGSNTAHCASVRSNRPVTAMVSRRSQVVSGSSWSMNRYRRTRSSSITDTPQPASPSCPLEPCGVRTYFADDLAGSGLTLRARRGRCSRRIHDVGHLEVGRLSGIRLAVAGADP
jgi:hypothetical protein